MSSMIEHMIDQALAVASSKAVPNDIACGVLGTIKRIRGVVEEIGSANTIPMLDGCLRNRMIIRSLRLGTSWAAPAASVELPMPGPGAAAATAIMFNVAEACLMVKEDGADDSEIFTLIFVLADRLFELLGGVPDITALFQRLREDEDIAGDGETMMPRAAGMLH